MELMQASRQWATRPRDERFVSLPDLQAFLRNQKDNSRRVTVANRDITVKPAGASHRDLVVTGPNGGAYAPSHWPAWASRRRASCAPCRPS